MKPTKDQIKQHFSLALRRSLDAYAALEDRDWGRKATSRWTARDFLAHLVITQEDQGNVLVRQALAGEPASLPGFEDREAINDHNEKQLAKMADVPATELLSRLKAAVEDNLQTLDALAEADLDKPAFSPGWGREGAVRDLFLASYLHLPGHYQDIRRAAKRKLDHWIEAGTPEEVNFHIGRIFHYMPLIYWPGRGGDMQATYLFTMDGEGGGQWAVRIDDGRAEAQDGAPQSFDCEVRTKPELWIDLSNNDLNPMWAITTRKVQLGGNASLAMKLGNLFQVS